MSASAGDVFEVHDAEIPFASAFYGPQRVRMALLGLGGGELLVVSPGAPWDEAWGRAIAQWGTPRYLLAPNHFHNAGLEAWKARYPDAAVVAHARALPRLRKKFPALAVDDCAKLATALPAGVRLFGPPMAKQGETWLSVRTREGVAWYVTDGLVNEERLPGGPLGLFMRMLGFRTGLLMNPFFARLFVEDRAAYAEWVRVEIERDRPTVLVPAHGAVMCGEDVGERILRAVGAHARR